MPGEITQNYDVVKDANLDNGDLKYSNQSLKDLIQEINELKDYNTDGELNKGNDDMSNLFEKVGSKDASLKITSGLKESLINKCSATDVRKIIDELWKLNNEAWLWRTDEVKTQVSNLITLLENDVMVAKRPSKWDEFENYVNGNQLNKLNKLSEKEMNEIVDFIWGLSVEDAQKLSLKLDAARDWTTRAGGKIKSTDERWLNNIQLALVARHRSGSLEDVREAVVNSELLSEIPVGADAQVLNEAFDNHQLEDKKLVWDGAKLDANIIKNIEGKNYTAQQFVDRFNKVNEDRIKNVWDMWLKFLENSDNKAKLNFIDWNIDVENSKEFINSLNNLILVNNYHKNAGDELNSDHFKDIRKSWEEKLKSLENENIGNWVEINLYWLNEGNVKDINRVYGGDKKFLELKDDMLSYNLDNVKDFLQNIVTSKNFSEFWNLNRKGGSYEVVGKPKWKAINCAVQILLMQGGANKNLKVDWKWIKGRDFCNAIAEFQWENGIEPSDWKLTYSTVSKLLWVEASAPSESVPGSNGEAPRTSPSPSTTPENTVDNSGRTVEISYAEKLWLDVVTNPDVWLNIPDNVKVYKNIVNTSDKWLYYVEWDKLVRVSAEDPWVKRTADMPSGEGAPLPEVDKMSVDLNVSDKWVSQLNDIVNSSSCDVLKKSGFIFNKSADSKSYEMKVWENVLPLPEKFFMENFCGQSDMQEKLKYVKLAVDFTKDNSVLTSVEYLGQSGYYLPNTKYEIQGYLHNSDDFFVYVQSLSSID